MLFFLKFVSSKAFVSGFAGGCNYLSVFRFIDQFLFLAGNTGLL